MIHRFLIYDKKFNCRLDRRYPLAQFILVNNKEINSNPILHPKTKIKQKSSIESDSEQPQIAPADSSEIVTSFSNDWQINNHKWNTLNIKEIQFEDFEDISGDNVHSDENDLELFSPSQGSLVSQMSRLEIERQEQELKKNSSGQLVGEQSHSQQLILGLTHSLKNMLMKLGPVPTAITTPITNTNFNSSRQNQSISLEGYSFAFKTSKYRIHYFESFTGWRLVMITDCLQSTPQTSATTSTQQVTPESALKLFYSQVLLKFLVAYPLGTIYTTQKSTENQRTFVENDFLHRAGFLSKMDEFVQSIDRIY